MHFAVIALPTHTHIYTNEQKKHKNTFLPLIYYGRALRCQRYVFFCPFQRLNARIRRANHSSYNFLLSFFFTTYLCEEESTIAIVDRLICRSPQIPCCFGERHHQRRKRS